MEVTKLYSGIYDRFYVKARNRFLDFDKYCRILPNHGVTLDIGCSRGALANHLALNLPDNIVIGIDSDKKRIKVASATVDGRDNIFFMWGDAVKWDIPECTGVVMTDFLHHISQHEQYIILNKVYQRLSSDGVLVISECDALDGLKYWASYLSDIVLYGKESNFRSLRDWVKMLQNIGFNMEVKRLSNPIFSQIMLICWKEA